jgi:glutamyl/glutaminyl-tRNA synthetase
LALSTFDPKLATPLSYRGRLAPSPTGLLHLGHARTFWTAQCRARERRGVLVLRNEDLDLARCRPQFVDAMYEDLRWFGLSWDEGPDCGGARFPYSQSERRSYYVSAMEKLRDLGWIYPCSCSRKDVLRALQAPHASEDEPMYPGTCRSRRAPEMAAHFPKQFSQPAAAGSRVNWRFRVPDNQLVEFFDGRCGPQRFVAGRDFGDFIVWRHDDLPAYQLAVVVDDAAMGITEVVRGEDLLRSTARQLLLYSALGLPAPAFYHCLLMTDASGARLAKRHDALSLRALRQQGQCPGQIRSSW